MRVVVIACALGGCQLVFPIEEPPIDPACRTKATAIFDEFDDGTIVPLWDSGTDGTNTVTEAGGMVTLTAASVGLARLTSIAFVDLLDSHASIQIDYDTPLVDQNYVSFELLTPLSDTQGNGPRVELRARHDASQGDQLEIAHQIDTQRLVIRTVPFDKATMGSWKIAREGESTVWYAGPIGGPLQRLADFPLPDLRFVRPQIVTTMDSTPFSAFASQFNEDGPHSKVCPAESLIDDFESGTIDPVQWGRLKETGCGFRAQDGGAVLVDNTNSGAVCEVGATGLYNLLRHSLTIEVDAVLMNHESFYLVAANLTGVTSSFVYRDNELRAETTDAGGTSSVMTATYDPELHKFWRFEGFDEGSGPQLKWSVSGDGHTFTEFGRSPTLTDLERLRFAFGMLNYGGSLNGTTVRVDNVNVSP